MYSRLYAQTSALVDRSEDISNILHDGTAQTGKTKQGFLATNVEIRGSSSMRRQGVLHLNIKSANLSLWAGWQSSCMKSVSRFTISVQRKKSSKKSTWRFDFCLLIADLHRRATNCLKLMLQVYCGHNWFWFWESWDWWEIDSRVQLYCVVQARRVGSDALIHLRM